MIGLFSCSFLLIGFISVSGLLLLVPQGVNGIEARRFPGGIIAKNNSDGGGYGYGGDDGRKRGHCGPVQQGSDGDRDAAPDKNPSDAASEAEHDRLDQELPEDVARACANGHAYADLTGSLGDRDEHDIHDADSTNDQGDERDDQEQTGHDAAGGSKGFGDFRKITYPEIVRRAGWDVMAVAQKRRKLAYGQRNVLGRTGRHINVIQIGKASHLGHVGRLDGGLLRIKLELLIRVKLAEGIDLTGRRSGGWLGGLPHAGDAVFDGRPRCDHVIILVAAHHARAFFAEDSHDDHADVFDAYLLTERGLVLKEPLKDSLADEADAGGATDILKGERLTLRKLPFSNGQVVGGRPANIIRVPVAIAVNDLRPAIHARGDAPNRTALVADSVGVVRRER